MEYNIKELIDQGKFVRIDNQGEHIESFEEFCKQSVEDILTSLNRYPTTLIDIYNKTQNKKFLNDIGLALSFGFFVDMYEALKSDYEQDQQKIKNLDEAYEKLRQEFSNYKKVKSESLLEENNNLKEKLDKVQNELDFIKEKYETEKEAYIVASGKATKQIETLRNSETTLYKRIEEYEKLIAAHEEAIKKLSREKDSQICLDPEDVSTMMRIIKKYSIDETKFKSSEVETKPSREKKIETNSKINTIKNTLREGVDHNTCDTNPPLVIA